MNAKLLTSIVAGTLLLAACGSDDAAPGADDPAGDPAAAADATGGDGTGTAASGFVAVGATDLGDVLVDPDGLTLYGFTDDADGVPTCFDACAEAWPPILVDGAELPAGLDPAVFSVVERPGEGFQLVAGDWPLYLFAGDAGPGDTNGQGVGGNWFVAAPDGSLVDAG